MLTALDLFSGIGGFALGFHRAGIRTTAFCEVGAYQRRVLAKNFPDIPIFEDVRTLNAAALEAAGVALPDIVSGGFPCQDISTAGRGAGIHGERSGLWWEFHRLIGEIRPRWVVAENVSALRSRGLDEVLGSLAEIGYDAEWHCVPAAAVGAPHRRDRIWIIAHPHAGHDGREGCAQPDLGAEEPRQQAPFGHDADGLRAPLADTLGAGLEVLLHGHARELAASLGASPWAAEPDVGRVAYGVPSRVDRLVCLGNAVVPIIPEIIGRAIRARSVPSQE